MPDPPLSGAAQGAVLAVGAVAIALPFAALSIKPLRKIFVTHEAQNKNDLTGQICIVTTSKVTESFGQATTEDGSMILNIRSDEPNEISKGDRLMLLGYDAPNDRYDVVLDEEFMSALTKDYVK